MKCLRDIPWYVPLWTRMWQFLHSGTCLRLMRAIIFVKESSLILMVFICLTWCISTWDLEPQLAQGCFSALIVDIFQVFMASGSSKNRSPRKLFGRCISLGGGKSRVTSLPSLRLMRRLMSFPYRSLNSAKLSFSLVF